MTDAQRRSASAALRAAVAAWSPRSYETRLVFAAVLSAALARWVALSPLWAAISAILVLGPDPAQTRRNSAIRFVATLIGGGASVLVVALGLPNLAAFALALAITCTLCAAADLEEGLRPACVATAVLLIHPLPEQAERVELGLAVARILAVLGGGAVALAVASLPGRTRESIPLER